MKNLITRTLIISTLFAIVISCKDQASKSKTETVFRDTPSICPPGGAYDDPPAAVFAGLQSIDKVTDKSVRLNWTKVPEGKSYIVYQKNDQGEFEVARSVNSNSKRVVMKGLDSNSTYEFMVRYLDSRGLHDLNEVSLTATTLRSAIYANSKSLEFRGTQSINIAPSNQLTPNDTLTASVWFKTSTSQSDARIINFHKGSGASSAIYLSMENQRLGLGYRDANDDFKRETINGNYSDGEWHNAVVTYNGNIYVVYVDGVRQVSITDSFIGFGSHPAHIGSYTGTQRTFTGLIDEVSIWRSALSANRVVEIYNQGTPNNLKDHTRYNTLMAWYRLGDKFGNSIPADDENTIYDHSDSGYNGSPNNFRSSDFKNDAP